MKLLEVTANEQLLHLQQLLLDLDPDIDDILLGPKQRAFVIGTLKIIYKDGYSISLRVRLNTFELVWYGANGTYLKLADARWSINLLSMTSNQLESVCKSIHAKIKENHAVWSATKLALQQTSNSHQQPA